MVARGCGSGNLASLAVVFGIVFGEADPPSPLRFYKLEQRGLSADGLTRETDGRHLTTNGRE